MKDKSNIISSLLPKPELSNEPHVLDFMKSLPQKFADTERLLSSSNRNADDNVLQNRIRLGRFIHLFHSEADTLHDNIITQCVLLSNPETKLFVSTHQPNLFAYSDIFKKYAPFGIVGYK